MARKLVVEIVGDSRSYERALGRSATATNQFGQAVGTASPRLGKLQSTMALTGTSGTLLAGVAAGLAVHLGGKAVEAASDLNEQISRTEVIMGKSAKAMLDWSETTASSMGISQRAALASAATFAGLFQTVGVSQKEAGEFSRVLVQLAADLASLGNTTPEEALIALRSGLAGEAEPLRRYNVFLTEASVQQQALADTGKKTTASLTQQEKTMARYNIILRQTAPAQGNFALTSGELANQQRIARAEIDDLAASAGQGLVPAMEAAVGVMGLFAGSLNDVIDGMGRFKRFLEDTEVFDGWNKGVEDAAKGTRGFLENIRDSIPFMERFLELRADIIGGGVGPTTTTDRRRHGLGGKPAQTPKEIAAAEARAGQAVIDRITRQTAAQKNLNTQIANSVARATHLADLIRQDPNNAKLQKRYSDELQKQNSLREQQVRLNEQNAAANERAAAAAREATLAQADLAVAQAGLTKSLQDDLVASKAREATLRRLVALNREDVGLANDLVSATQARRDIEREIADRKRTQRNQAAFKALGLTPEGLKPTPSGGALLKRATGLEEQLKGTIFDKGVVGKQLRAIIAWLKKNLKGASQQVRAIVLGMLNDIDNAINQGDKTGPLTKGAGLNVGKVLEGLGLTPEQEREARLRLSHVGAGGKVLAGPPTKAPGAQPGGGVIPGQIVVESHTTINLDGQKVANVVTRQQQKTGRRNPPQKRGPNTRGIK